MHAMCDVLAWDNKHSTKRTQGHDCERGQDRVNGVNGLRELVIIVWIFVNRNVFYFEAHYELSCEIIVSILTTKFATHVTKELNLIVFDDKMS